MGRRNTITEFQPFTDFTHPYPLSRGEKGVCKLFEGVKKKMAFKNRIKGKNLVINRSMKKCH
jgi:hypothetical protein